MIEQESTLRHSFDGTKDEATTLKQKQAPPATVEETLSRLKKAEFLATTSLNLLLRFVPVMDTKVFDEHVRKIIRISNSRGMKACLLSETSNCKSKTLHE